MIEYGTTLQVKLHPDRWVARMLLCGHAAAGLAAMIPFTAAPMLSILLGAAVCASLRLCYREHVERSAPGAVRAFTVSRTGEWWLVRNAAAAPEEAQLKSWALGDRWLVLRFRLPRTRARSIILSAGATAPDVLRQLRARVRLSAASVSS